MTAKTSKARIEAFFKALTETGNQTISAERACVSRSWVTLHRSTDPAFKARMEACIAQARERLSAAGGIKPDSKWGNINGEELVVRGSNGRVAQVSRARLKQFTPRVEERFLSVLARTCNVKLAAQAIGMSAKACYDHYHRWPHFAKRWDEAAADGELWLEMALLENGIRSLDPDSPVLDDEPALPMQPMSVDDVIRILGMRRAVQRFGGKLVGNRRAAASEEEAVAAIQKQLRKMAIKRGDAVPPVERQWKGGRRAKGKSQGKRQPARRLIPSNSSPIQAGRANRQRP